LDESLGISLTYLGLAYFFEQQHANWNAINQRFDVLHNAIAQSFILCNEFHFSNASKQVQYLFLLLNLAHANLWVLSSVLELSDSRAHS